ncbi:conserved hypothetical protein [Ricinus communis]|uniref:Uncharacterized protein n=1 Tax=Ricinus communis TaxID=3988 RepID=B9R6Q5_RICCO|nr:conserved hypothetical protein [Ricinus communis]
MDFISWSAFIVGHQRTMITYECEELPEILSLFCDTDDPTKIHGVSGQSPMVLTNAGEHQRFSGNEFRFRQPAKAKNLPIRSGIICECRRVVNP